MTMMKKSIAALSSFLASFLVMAHGFVPSGRRQQFTFLHRSLANNNDVRSRKSSSSLLRIGADGGGSGGGGPLDNLFAFFKQGKVGLVKSLAGAYDPDAVREKIDGLVKKNAVFMFSFTTCPYCIKGTNSGIIIVLMLILFLLCCICSLLIHAYL